MSQLAEEQMEHRESWLHQILCPRISTVISQPSLVWYIILMSSVPYLTLVSKQSTNVHDNYHRSSIHFIGFFSPILLSFNEKITQILFGQKYLSSIELLFKERTILIDPPASCFCLRKQLFLSIQIPLSQKLSFINISICGKNYFDQFSFYLRTEMASSIPLPFRETIFFINSSSILN